MEKEKQCDVCKTKESKKWYGFGEKFYCEKCSQNIPVVAKVIRPEKTDEEA